MCGKMAMNGTVAAKDDGYIGAGKVVGPREGLVCLKGTQMRLSSMRSDDSNGAQAGAGYCKRVGFGEITDEGGG